MTLLQDVNTAQDANAKTSLSFTEILNLYLWGQTDGMADKLSEVIPHMRAHNELTLNISMQSFMNECANIINIFNAGDGEDSISDSSASDSPAHNIVLMGEVLRAEDALVGREGNHLIIQFLGSENSLKIYNFFGSNTRPVDQICFADGL